MGLPVRALVLIGSGKNYNYVSPRNCTLESSGKRTVVLVQPLDHTGRDLIFDPILTNELIYDAAGIFSNRFPVKDLRINKIKGIITVQYSDDVPWEFLLGLTFRDHLGEYPVKIYIPNSDLFSHGTISPVSLRLSDERILQWLVADSVEIVKVERLKKRKQDSSDTSEWVDSETIKVTFKSNQIPKGVKLAGSYYKTRLYIPFPVQCWKCQRLGHMSSSCKGKTRCRKCAGNHQKKECTSTVMRCAHCSGPHNANSRDCPIIQKACELEKEKVLNGSKKNFDAEKPTPQLTIGNSFPDLHNKSKPVVTSEQPQVRALYSHAVAGSSSVKVQEKCPCPCENSPHPAAWPDRDFFEKLKNFILEICSMVSHGESGAARSLLATSAIRNHFGIDLTEQQYQTESDILPGSSDPTRKRPLNSPDGDVSENMVEEEVLSDSPEGDSFVVSGEYEWKSPKRKRKKGNKSRKELVNKRELFSKKDFLKKK